MSRTIEYANAQKKLVVLWCTFSLAVFILFFIQTLTGKYLGHMGEVWEWVLQFIIPPLTLIIGVLISQVTSEPNTRKVDIFYFRLALGFSLFFLVLLFLSAMIVPVLHQAQNSSVLISEITEENKRTIIDAFESYNAFLMPVQGISTLTLGLFFSRTK